MRILRGSGLEKMEVTLRSMQKTWKGGGLPDPSSFWGKKVFFGQDSFMVLMDWSSRNRSPRLWSRKLSQHSRYPLSLFSAQMTSLSTIPCDWRNWRNYLIRCRFLSFMPSQVYSRVSPSLGVLLGCLVVCTIRFKEICRFFYWCSRRASSGYPWL